jgi:iron complex outermembrane receptor protein
VTNDNLLPERAKMWDFSIQGLIENTSIDYQFSVFNIHIKDKLTQLGARMSNLKKHLIHIGPTQEIRKIKDWK